jgi:hypothetical protein
MKPSKYLESVKNLLLTDFRITTYQIVREFEETQKRYIRARLTLSDESFLEFSEYIEKSSEDDIQITDYSYHWVDKTEVLFVAGIMPTTSPNSKTLHITFTLQPAKRKNQSHLARRRISLRFSMKSQRSLANNFT